MHLTGMHIARLRSRRYPARICSRCAGSPRGDRGIRTSPATRGTHRLRKHASIEHVGGRPHARNNERPNPQPHPVPGDRGSGRSRRTERAPNRLQPEGALRRRGSVMSLPGRALRRLTSTPQLYESSPVYPPTGDAVAFIRGALHADDLLWITDLDGRERALTPSGGYLMNVVWSPSTRRTAACNHSATPAAIRTPRSRPIAALWSATDAQPQLSGFADGTASSSGL